MRGLTTSKRGVTQNKANLGLPAFRTVRKKFLLFKLSRLWDFVIAPKQVKRAG